jgi:hypothetical protein
MQAVLSRALMTAERLALIRKLPRAQRMVTSLLCLPVRALTMSEKLPRHSVVLSHFSVNRIIRPVTVRRPPGPSRRPDACWGDVDGDGAITVTTVA